MMRTEPGQVEAVFPMVEEALLGANDGRNVRVETLAEVKAQTFSAQTAIVKMLGGVIVLLIFVTGLGIVGITSFSVTERTHTIGTRRALGARQFDILRYFLTENWVIISSGLVLGIGLTLLLNYLLVTFVNGAKLSPSLLVYGVILMWALGLVSALFPAWKGARIPPAIATRNV
jgi:putative ABC transport system permease protein